MLEELQKPINPFDTYNGFAHVLFRDAPIGMTLFDDQGRFFDCNKSILKIFGINRDYYIAHTDKLSPEYQPSGAKSKEKKTQILRRALSGESFSLEWLHCTPEGIPIPCQITLTRTKIEDRYIGMAYVFDLRNIRKLENDIEFLKTEADQIYFDSLTGIRNRRYLDENLSSLLHTLSRSNSVLSVMMIDIDFFKRFNDTYGHTAGDICLKSIGKALENTLKRGDDFVVRFGGEEFVVVLPNTDEEGGRFIAEQLLENVCACNIPHEKNEAAKCITISIGLTTALASFKQKPEDYIKRADDMLYLSKQDGRNRYSFAPLED